MANLKELLPIVLAFGITFGTTYCQETTMYGNNQGVGACDSFEVVNFKMDNLLRFMQENAKQLNALSEINSKLDNMLRALEVQNPAVG